MIKVETFCDTFLNANTYLISDDQYAVIIDPANNIKTLNKFVGEKQVVAILLTHGHYDHFKEIEKYIKEYNVKCYLHKEAYKKIFNVETSYASSFGENKVPNIKEEVFIMLKENQILQFGQIKINTWFTPGHTNCSVIYFIDDLMFSGDTLFKNSIGRTDLATGNLVAMRNSLDRIKKLKTNYFVYPGHDESTTLFDELKNNLYLK